VITLGSRNSRRLILAVDLRSYSKHSFAGQDDAQVRLQRVMGYALRRARVARVRVQRQQQGDGQLVIFPPALDEPAVVPSLILGLRDGLYHLNLAPGAFGRMQMRAALGQGVVARSANGYVGDSVVRVSRLLDAEVLRKALEQATGSDLALALAPELYREVISHDAPGLPAAQFEHRQMEVPGKDFAAEAWLHLPHSSPGVDLRAAATVRWGDSPALTTLRAYVVPAVIALHAAETARYLMTSTEPLLEWELDQSGADASAGQHVPSEQDHADASFDFGLEHVDSGNREDANHPDAPSSDHSPAEALDRYSAAAYGHPGHDDRYGHDDHHHHGDHNGYGGHSEHSEDHHRQHHDDHDHHWPHHHSEYPDHHDVHDHSSHARHDDPGHGDVLRDHPIDTHHPGSPFDVLHHLFHHAGSDDRFGGQDAAEPPADAGH
jgi:hypothetical protein